MTTPIRIRPFLGIAPMTDPAMLPFNAAQVADNCRFNAGNVRPWSDPATVRAQPAEAGGTLTLYRFGQEPATPEGQFWCASNQDLNFARALIASDTVERTLITGGGQPPRYFTAAQVSGVASNNPSSTFLLGVPAPATAIALANVSIAGPATGTIADRTYFQTFTNDRAEESPPSPAPRNANNQIIATCAVYPNQTVTLNNLGAPPGGAYEFGANARRRIYRTTTTGVKFVGQVPIATQTFVDDRSDAQLSATLQSVTYDPPLSTLVSLVAGHNGIMGAIDSATRDLHHCHPFAPHAWSTDFIVPLSHKPIAYMHFGESFVALTTAGPVLVTGQHPSQLTPVPLFSTFPQTIASKRSATRFNGGVAWASMEGMCWIGPGGPRILTAGIYDDKTWQSLNPASMHAHGVGTRLFVFYDNGTPGCLMLDLSDPNSPVTRLSLSATAAFADPARNALYMQIGNNIQRFDAGAGALGGGFLWRSKRFTDYSPGVWAWARLLGTGYPVTFRFYVNGTLVFTKTVANRLAFRLPSAQRSDTVEFEIAAAGPVYEVQIAGSMQDLKQLQTE